jgi:hypothetical protein
MISIIYVQSNVVNELPPRESFKSLVSFESLNGIYLFSPGVVKAINTIFKLVRDRLILMASLALSPVAPVFLVYFN